MNAPRRSLLIKGARLFDPGTGLDQVGDLLCEDGRIAEIGSNIEAVSAERINGQEIDAKGQILCPGLIDMRCHAVDMPAATAGGITTAILQPDQTTVIDHDAMVERIRRRASDLGGLKVFPMGAATKGMAGSEIAEIGQMLEAGALAFTDCTHPVSDARVMRRLLQYASSFDALIVQFAQEAALAAGGVAHEGEIATRLGLPGIPAVAEVMQIERDVRLLQDVGGRLHFALLSTAAGVEAVRRAKDSGLAVTAATAPHYLHLNDNATEGWRSFARLSPPLRSEDDRLALITGLADGSIDCLVSDHQPRSEDAKRLPFEQAAAGVYAQDSMLALGMNLVHAGHLSLKRLIEAVTARPSALLGLPSGRLAMGAPADLCLFNPTRPWRIERGNKNRAFDLLPVQGLVTLTVCDGQVHRPTSSEGVPPTAEAGR